MWPLALTISYQTSSVQGKTQMAVQSLAMTELQIGEQCNVCWKWQQKGPFILRLGQTTEGATSA